MPSLSSKRSCNGHAALCDRPYGNVTFLGAHDSFASSKHHLARKPYRAHIVWRVLLMEMGLIHNSLAYTRSRRCGSTNSRSTDASRPGSYVRTYSIHSSSLLICRLGRMGSSTSVIPVRFIFLPRRHVFNCLYLACVGFPDTNKTPARDANNINTIRTFSMAAQLKATSRKSRHSLTLTQMKYSLSSSPTPTTPPLLTSGSQPSTTPVSAHAMPPTPVPPAFYLPILILTGLAQV